MKILMSPLQRRCFQVLAAAVLFAGTAVASPKTLIELEGGKPKAGLAKSWTKVKDGEYQFELDMTQELKKDVKVSPAAVKQSFESKLGGKGVKVIEKGPSTVLVTYTGDEKVFLDEVAKTKVRGTKDVELALESSVSEGGIRAKTLDRAAAAGEVKGIVVASKAGLLTVKIRDSMDEGIKFNDRVRVKAANTKHKVKDLVYFMPEKKDGNVWYAKADTLK
jgi:hypothetical protein